VPPTPQIMGVGIVDDVRKSVTVDFKSEGNSIYIVGKETEREMGGSEYYGILGIDEGVVPKIDIDFLKKCIDGILSAISKGFVASCHDISEGGIAVCLSEMAIGGDIGCEVDLTNVGKDLRSDFKLFSESNTRWIIELKKGKEKAFEEKLKEKKIPFVLIGKTKNARLIINNEREKLVDLKIINIRDIWKNAIWNIMG
jgi:phosphoribosylformylglycinamidine synthase